MSIDERKGGAQFPEVIEGIIFDVDGTLYDQKKLRRAMSVRLISECLRNPREGLRAIRLIDAYREAHESLREKITDQLELQQLDIACKETGINREEADRIVRMFFQTVPLTYLLRYRRADLPDFLKKAQEQKIKLGIVSDYPAQKKLEAMEVHQYFNVVLSSTDPEVNRLKPDPKGLQLCMDRLGVHAEKTIYVGDRMDTDAKCAYQANVHPVILGAPTRLRFPCTFIGGISDLSRLIPEVRII